MSTAEKIDLYKLHKAEYAAPKKPKLIETEPAQFMVVSGTGGPGGDVFQNRVEALYAMAYTTKFISKSAGQDFTVCKLEGLYGIDGQSFENLSKISQDKWKWKLMIRMPDFVDDDQLDKTRSTLRDKGKEGSFDEVSLESIEEGLCVQMLHLGPYDQEEQTLEVMSEFVSEQELKAHRWHHEIYLSDPRRVPPEKLRTILRQPVQ